LSTKLRIFNEKGLKEFRDRLAAMRSTNLFRSLEDLVTDPSSTKVISSMEADFPRAFASRKDCGVYFLDLFGQCSNDLKRARVDPAASVELWSWITATMFLSLVAVEDGEVNVGEEARLVFMPDNHQRFYRHLLAGPYLICKEYEGELDKVEILLYNSVTKPNTVYVEQFASRRNILLSRGVMDLVTEMYFDRNKGQGKTFERPKNMAPTAGSPRRLSVVLSQLSLVWDVMDMSTADIKKILPSEFEPFYVVGN